MIYGTITKKETYDFLQGRLKKCFEYIQEHSLKDMALGRYELEGDALYMNLQEFETMPSEGRTYEAHRKYLDLHFIVDGAERVDVNFLDRMQLESYDETKDLAVLNGDAAGFVILREGDFMINYPADAHRPAGMEDHPQKIRKAVFKIRYE